MSGRYSFGDNDAAAARLAVVAEVFEGTSAALLRRVVPANARVAVDLGCGPGHTTALLRSVVGEDATVVGADASASFLTDMPGAVRADVTRLPLRDGCADVVYARFLLSHLPDPVAVARAWRRLLRAPHSVLVLEEPEAILTDDEDFTTYLELTAARVRAAGAEMYAGPLLARLGGDVVALDVSVQDAARMFTLNLASWGGDEHRDLAARLQAKTDGVVGWRLRQVVLRR